MTRKLYVASFVSLDGVIEEPTKIVANYFDHECKAYAHDKLASVEYFLMGRASYEMFVSRFPKIEGDKYIDRINGLQKLVASRTLQDVAWKARLLGFPVVEDLRKIKQQTGGDIMKYGITNLDRTLLEARLVDEYQIWMIPKAVGQGKRAFEDVDRLLLKLDLIHTHCFKNGVVVLTYVPR